MVRLPIEGDALWSFLERAGEVPLPPYIQHPPGPRIASATRPSSRACRAPSPRRPPACTSRPRCSSALDARGRRARARHAARRARARSSRPRRRHRGPPHAPRALRVPEATAAAIAARGAAASSRSAPPSLRALEASRRGTARAAARPTLFIYPGLPLPRRRSPAHELPPAAIDAADAGRARSPGASACSRAYRHAVGAALPLLQLRRRHADRRDATSCERRSSSSPTRAGAARAGTLHDAARRGRHAGVHAGRHAGSGEGHAPGRRSRATRRADRPRQHLPPLLRPGPGRGRRARRPAPLHGAGTAPILTDSGGFQVFSLAEQRKIDRGRRRVPLAPRRQPGTRSRPRGRCEIQVHARRRHRRWRSTSARRRDAPRGDHEALARAHHALGAALRSTPRRGRRAGRSSASCRAALSRTCARATPTRSPRWIFDGYALGGFAVGEAPRRCMSGLAERRAPLAAGGPAALPDGRRHARGSPRRASRAGRRHVRLRAAHPQRAQRPALHARGRLQIKAPRYARDPRPLDEQCRCYTCRDFSRAYLRHLFAAQELLSFRLAASTTSPSTWTSMAGLRAAIERGEAQRYAGSILESFAAGE